MKALTYIEHGRLALSDEPMSREAVRRFCEHFAYAQAHDFAPQERTQRA